MKCLKMLLVFVILLIFSSTPVSATEYDLNITLSMTPFTTPQFDEASLSALWGDWYITLGRPMLQYGPGKIGQLVLGPQVGLNAAVYGGAFSTLHFSQFIADIDGSARALVGHRFEVRGQSFRVGLSEVALLTGDPPNAFYAPLPFWSYLITDAFYQRANHPGYGANCVAGLDFSWTPVPEFELYGELAIDSMGYPVFDTTPTRIGMLAGMAIRNVAAEREFIAEYVRTSRYLYSHASSASDYTHNGVPLGHWLGPDADMLSLQYSWHPVVPLNNILRLDLQRHGEGEIRDDWTPLLGQGAFFLTGEVEYKIGAHWKSAYALSEYATITGYLDGEFTVPDTTGSAWGIEYGLGMQLQMRF